MQARTTIKKLGVILLILSLLVIILLAIGDYVLNRYLNNHGKETINSFLPINGDLNYNKVSIHPFRDFPNISVKIHGLKLGDSLDTPHKKPLLELGDLFLNASINSLRKKELSIHSIELTSLTLNILDRANGYSNLKSLIKKKTQRAIKDKTKEGWNINYDQSDLIIRDLHLHKINESKKQNAHLYVDEVEIKNVEGDSVHNLSLNLENILVSPSSKKSDGRAPAKINQAVAEIQLGKSFSSASLRSIEFKEGKIDLFTDANGLSNYFELLGSGKSNAKVDDKSKRGIDIELAGADVSLNDIDFNLFDQSSKKNLAARIVHLNTEIEVSPDTSAMIDVNLDVDQLAFNTTQGAFLTNSIVKGQIKTTYDHKGIGISCPNLSIDEDVFNTEAFIPLDEVSRSTLTIEKQDAVPEKIRPLLTKKIKNSILPYDVQGPLYAKAHIIFTKGVKKPRVNLELNVQNKTVVVKGEVIKNADVSAKFVNGFFDDARQYTEHKKNVRLFLHKVRGTFKDFKVETEDALITSSTKQGARLIAKAEVTGQASSASQFLNHDKFSFQEGAFTLTTDIDGSLRNLDDLLAGTDLNLMMKDMQVYYPVGNTTLPLRVLEMKKVGEKTIFEIEGLAIDNGSPIRIQGEVDHLASVLFPGQAEQLQTKANIRASSISWEGLVALFGQDGIISTTRSDKSLQAKRSMKQTISGIQQSFHPEVKVTIDTVHYGREVQLLDFNTGLNFKDDKTLVLEETNFKIDKSNVTLDGEVIINQLDFTKFDFDIDLQNLDFDVLMPKFDYFGIHLMKQIHDQPDNLSMHVELSGELDDAAGLKPESLDAKITYESFAEDKFSGNVTLKANPSTKKVEVIFGHSGHPRNLNYILGSEDYKFDKGWFNITFEFDDNFESVAQMVEESRIGLSVSDAEVYITELGVTVPLSRIEVASMDNKAYYYLLLKSDTLQQELMLDGIVNNIRHLAFKDTDDLYEVELNISSPRIVWNDLKQVMSYGSSSAPQQSGKIIKESLAKILQDFNPKVQLKIDRLEYSENLSFNDIFAQAYLEDDILKIEHANVAYRESQIEADIDMDISQKNELPFHLKLGLTNIDIAETLEHFEYFNVAELSSAKQIDGNVWFDLDMSSVIDLENNDFLTSKTEADIKFKLQDVIIEDLETINEISEKINRVDRFNALRFAPIESQIKVRGTRIIVEETEIQSNAMQAFVQGTIDKNSPENLWVSIPVKNAKKPDLESIPNKTGYAGTGRKIFLQWVSSQLDDDGKMKVRLRKKKYHSERPEGIKFRDFKKEVKRERKRIKKELKRN